MSNKPNYQKLVEALNDFINESMESDLKSLNEDFATRIRGGMQDSNTTCSNTNCGSNGGSNNACNNDTCSSGSGMTNTGCRNNACS